MKKINDAGLTEKYLTAISAYTSTAIFDKSMLNEVKKALGTRYLMFISLGTFQKQESFGYDIWLGYTTKKGAEVKAFVQIWDSSVGDVALEGNAIAESRISGELTKVEGYEEHARIAAKGIVDLIMGKSDKITPVRQDDWQ